MTPLLKGTVMSTKTKNEPDMLDDAIDRVLTRMQYLDTESDEYGTLLSRLDRLTSIKNAQKSDKPRISTDTLVSAGASILGIILILGYERVNVVTSKALGFVFKSKA
jgi:hypothetical protein